MQMAHFNWTPPAGDWKIVRFGYSLTGKQNHPASPEATGLEVDKMDAVAVKNYFENYLNQYKDATGGLMGSKGDCNTWLQIAMKPGRKPGHPTWHAGVSKTAWLQPASLDAGTDRSIL